MSMTMRELFLSQIKVRVVPLYIDHEELGVRDLAEQIGIHYFVYFYDVRVSVVENDDNNTCRYVYDAYFIVKDTEHTQTFICMKYHRDDANTVDNGPIFWILNVWTESTEYYRGCEAKVSSIADEIFDEFENKCGYSIEDIEARDIRHDPSLFSEYMLDWEKLLLSMEIDKRLNNETLFYNLRKIITESEN